MGDESAVAEHWEWHREFREAYNSCARCETDEHTQVQNFDRMWGDGDLICRQCGGYVRVVDTG